MENTFIPILLLLSLLAGCGGSGGGGNEGGGSGESTPSGTLPNTSAHVSPPDATATPGTPLGGLPNVPSATVRYAGQIRPGPQASESGGKTTMRLALEGLLGQCNQLRAAVGAAPQDLPDARWRGLDVFEQTVVYDADIGAAREDIVGPTTFELAFVDHKDPTMATAPDCTAIKNERVWRQTTVWRGDGFVYGFDYDDRGSPVRIRQNKLDDWKGTPRVGGRLDGLPTKHIMGQACHVYTAPGGLIEGAHTCLWAPYARILFLGILPLTLEKTLPSPLGDERVITATGAVQGRPAISPGELPPGVPVEPYVAPPPKPPGASAGASK